MSLFITYKCILRAILADMQNPPHPSAGPLFLLWPTSPLFVDITSHISPGESLPCCGVRMTCKYRGRMQRPCHFLIVLSSDSTPYREALYSLYRDYSCVVFQLHRLGTQWAKSLSILKLEVLFLKLFQNTCFSHVGKSSHFSIFSES
jgi:hypothetical protein